MSQRKYTAILEESIESAARHLVELEAENKQLETGVIDLAKLLAQSAKLIVKRGNAIVKQIAWLESWVADGIAIAETDKQIDILKKALEGNDGQ